jgi:uncharacterized protein (TIGR02147 family)
MEVTKPSDGGYRLWLSEHLETRRKRNPSYSLRAFARSLNIPAASLSQIMRGKRPLTLKTALRLAESFELSPTERQAFLSSVVWEKTGAAAEKVSKSKYREIEADTFAIISDWYHYGILSLGEIKPNYCEPKWISRQLGITQVDARGALRRLFDLGFLKKVGRGFAQATPSLDIQCASKSAALRKYHRQNLRLAEKALDGEPIPLRDFNSMTMAIDPDRLPEAKEAIRKFRDEISNLLEKGKRRRVYTLAIQLFPISKSAQERDI